MFGKSIIKLIGLIFAGAIALAGGAELLASVVGVVLAFRSGNPFPLLLVGIVTVILLRIVKRQKSLGINSFKLKGDAVNKIFHVNTVADFEQAKICNNHLT